MDHNRKRRSSVKLDDGIANYFQSRAEKEQITRTELINRCLEEYIWKRKDNVIVTLIDLGNQIDTLKEKIKYGEEINQKDLNLLEKGLKKLWQ